MAAGGARPSSRFVCISRPDAWTERASRLPIALMPDVVTSDALTVRLDAINALSRMRAGRRQGGVEKPVRTGRPAPSPIIVAVPSSLCWQKGEANTPGSEAIRPTPFTAVWTHRPRSCSGVYGCGNPTEICEVGSEGGVLLGAPVCWHPNSERKYSLRRVAFDQLRV